MKEEKWALRVNFDRKLKLEFHETTISSNVGLLVYRELDEVLGLTTDLEDLIDEPRGGQKYPAQTNRFAAAIGFMVVWLDTKIPNDTERLRVDPSLRRIVGGRVKDHIVASTSEMSRFETEIPATDGNLKNLTDLCGLWVDQVDDRIPMK